MAQGKATPEEVRLAVIESFLGGSTVREAASACGVSHQTAWEIRRDIAATLEQLLTENKDRLTLKIVEKLGEMLDVASEGTRKALEVAVKSGKTDEVIAAQKTAFRSAMEMLDKFSPNTEPEEELPEAE